MPIYAAINNLKQNFPNSESAAQMFLSTLAPKVQEQLINAIYLGREHIHVTTLLDDPNTPIDRTYVDHISNDEYARIVYEKRENAITYLDRLVLCAKNSNFDLNNL